MSPRSRSIPTPARPSSCATSRSTTAGGSCNHAVVEGQLHGGLMQGIGQIFGEECVYDRDSGQLLTGTFMDYFMPRADHLPAIALYDRSNPSPSNPLGVKGAGEAGTTGAIPAVANAVLDALKPLGIIGWRCPTRRTASGRRSRRSGQARRDPPADIARPGLAKTQSVALFRQNPVGGFVSPKALRWLWSAKMAAGGFVLTKPVGGFGLRKIRRWLCSAKIPPLGCAPDMPSIPLALISRATRTYDRRQAQECIG